ncbi:MAG TPA: PIN domain-containing protein [Blastocatellia bacterium]|nr:PIN domain-containing protein [Blastocatellia bacterium]
MSALFVDTSGWACIADRRESHHADAAGIYREARKLGQQIVTTNYILAELVSLLTSPKRLPRSDIISFIEAIRSASYVEFIHVNESLDYTSWQFLKNRQDKDWSLVDCVSFVIMQDRGILEALTTDHHFEQAGFIRLLK